MSGIVGYVGRKQAKTVLQASREGLGKGPLGVILLNGKGFEAEGKGRIGLGAVGTRPHVSCDGRFAVVLDGTPGNRAALRRSLHGHRFRSSESGELVAHLVEEEYRKIGYRHPLRAVTRVMEKLSGRVAAGFVCADHPDLLLAASIGRGLLLGTGKGEQLLATGSAALVPHVRKAVALRAGEVAKLDPKGVTLFDRRFQRRKARPGRLKVGGTGKQRRNRSADTT